MIIVQLDLVNSTEIIDIIYYQTGNKGIREFIVDEIEKFVKTALNTLPNIKPEFKEATADGYRLGFQNAEFAYHFVKKFCEDIDTRNQLDIRSWWFRIGAAKDDEINTNYQSDNLRVGKGLQKVKELETEAIPGWIFVDNSTYTYLPDDIKKKFSEKWYINKHKKTKQAWACQMMFSDDLNSNHNIDYTILQTLLKAKRWQDANAETYKVILKTFEAGNQKYDCTDLRTIDQLWVKYSKGRFGFRVQKMIWESVDKDYEKFGNRVGWKKIWWKNKNIITDWLNNTPWITGQEVIFKIEAPEGHLPLGSVFVGIQNFWIQTNDGLWRINGTAVNSYGILLSQLSIECRKLGSPCF